MRRDMDLVRDILSGIAGAEGDMDARAFVNEERSFQMVAYHFEIMEEAGLLSASVQRSGSGRYCSARATRLTWDGNDFLSATSNGEVWQEVKMQMAQKAVDAPFSVVKQLAVSACARLLGIG